MQSPLSHISLLVLLGLTGCWAQTMNSVEPDKSIFAPTRVDGGGNGRDLYLPKVQQILRTNCAHCHAAFPTYSDTDWETPGKVVRNVAAVVPGNLAGSLLYSSLKGSGVGGNEDMPHDGGQLSSEDMATIKNWIINLAQVSVPSPAPSTSPSTVPSASPSSGAPLNAAQRTAAALAVMQGNSCMDCHDSAKTATSAAFQGKSVPAFANFTADGDFVTNGLVIKGNPSTSWIYRSLLQFGDINLMPQDNPALSPADAQALSDWITQMGNP